MTARSWEFKSPPRHFNLKKKKTNLKKLFYYFIQHYKLNFVIFVAGTILGIAGLLGLQREARPPVDFARVIITTAHPGTSSEEVEELITNKLEEKLQNIRGIRHSYSTSSPGLSQITIYLDLDNTDTEKTVDEIYRAVQNVNDLPPDLLELPSILHVKAEEIPIMSIAIIGPDQKRNRMAHELKILLQNLPDVANIRLTGFQKREYQILLNTQKTEKYSISPSEVATAVKSHSLDISAGRVRSEKTQSSVRIFGKIRQAKELENIVVRSNFSGKQIFVKDIASVKDAEEDKTASFFVKGKSAVVLQVSKKAKTDMLKTVRQIKKFLSLYKKRISSDTKIVILFDESEKTSKRLNIVISNALFGLILVLLILIICLPGWLGVVTAFSLPFSILSTVALSASMGVTFNVITMCAFIICIGMLVDNSIVISERYAQLRLQNIPPEKSALQSVLDLFRPVFATTITTILAFLPMLITKGVMGQFIQWLPIVVSMALMISLIESFFLLPCRLKFTVSSQKHRRDSALFLKVRNRFESFILQALNKKYLSLFIIVCVVLGSFFVSKFKNRWILFPKENVEVYSAIFEMNKSDSLKEMEKKSLNLEQQIKTLIIEKNIKHTYIDINSLTGKGTLNMEVLSSVARKWNHKEVLKKLRTIDDSPFKKLRFEALRLGPPIGRPVELILFSKNEQQLESSAKETLKMFSSVKGLLNIEDSREYSGPEYAIYPNTSLLSRLGLNTKIVGSVLRTALHGDIVSEVTENGESFYVRVKYENKRRSNIDSLKHVNIFSPKGGELIPINQLIRWKKREKGAEVKKHYFFSPSVTFYADVDLNQTTSITANAEIKKKVKSLLKKYPSVTYKQTGEQESTQESLNSLVQAMILVVFGIFAVLLLMFNSFSISILILSNVFLGLVGISWSFLLHSKPLSFFAMIGTVGLAGVVINSAIILVSFIEKLKRENKTKNLNKVLAKASADRLRPIFITTITTVLGLFPTAYGIGGYDSVLIPVTLSLTWGLISGTLLTLIWTPCGYAVIYELTDKIKNLIKRVCEKTKK